MVYYTHWVGSTSIIFEYITHNDSYFIYRLYNHDYADKTFLLIYHNNHGFTVIREINFDMNKFEENPKTYFMYNISSRNEYLNTSETTGLERSIGQHKYTAADNDIDKYTKMLEENPNMNINNIHIQENGMLGAHIFHFAPNIYCANICTMYQSNKENKAYLSYIYIKYNKDKYQVHYELNNGNPYFM